MTRCSVQPRDRIFVESYGFLSLLQKWVKRLVKISVKA